MTPLNSSNQSKAATASTSQSPCCCMSFVCHPVGICCCLCFCPFSSRPQTARHPERSCSRHYVSNAVEWIPVFRLCRCICNRRCLFSFIQCTVILSEVPLHCITST